MEMKRAGDIMIPLDKYPHLPYWFTLRQATVEMEKSEVEIEGRKSLPRVILIFDEKYQLMGMARRRDIMRGLEPQFLLGRPIESRKTLFDVKVDPNLSELSYDKLLQGIRRQAERPIGEVMRPIVATVDVQDHLVKVIYEMVDRNLSVLPVLEEGKVAGVVRSVDAFHEIAEILL
ncbi:MAG: CBS domain-containing protein [Thermodesulfobacteriota bacterium]